MQKAPSRVLVEKPLHKKGVAAMALLGAGEMGWGHCDGGPSGIRGGEDVTPYRSQEATAVLMMYKLGGCTWIRPDSSRELFHNK